MLRGFVVLRVVVVSTLLLSAFLIQFTFSTSLPLNDIYYLAAFAYSISIVAILSLDRIPAEANAAHPAPRRHLRDHGARLHLGRRRLELLVPLPRHGRGGRDPPRTAGRPRRGRPRVRLLRRPRRPHVLRRPQAAPVAREDAAPLDAGRRSSARSRSTRGAFVVTALLVSVLVGQAARDAHGPRAPQVRDRAAPGAPHVRPRLDVLGRPHDGPGRARHVREPRRPGPPRRRVGRPRRPARPDARPRRRGRVAADRGRGLGDPALRDDAPHPRPGRVLRRLVVGAAGRLGLHRRPHPHLPERHARQAARGRGASQGQARGRRRARGRHRPRDPQPPRVHLGLRSGAPGLRPGRTRPSTASWRSSSPSRTA